MISMPEAIIKIRKHSNLTIPADILSQLPFKEGDQVKITAHKTYLKIELIEQDPFTKIWEILGKVDFRDEERVKKAEELFFEND